MRDFDFDLPMPGVARIRLGAGRGTARRVSKENHDEIPPAFPLSAPRFTALGVAVAAAVAVGASACSGANVQGGGTTQGTGSGTLTIQGDAGNPTLVENFNPFLAATELHGGYLIYAPLEIPSPVDGSYTPYLATGYQFTNPTTLVYTICDRGQVE